MKLVYCSANIYLLVYISHFFPIISRRHLKHTADKCTRAREFKKPFIFCFITLRYIQAKINEQLIQHLKNKNGKKRLIWLQNTNHQIKLWFSLQIDNFSFWFEPVAGWSVDFLFNYLLVYWSSFFFVAGWQAFGISLAWVEHIPALFQFWSGDILHCHLGGGKLKQPFFLRITKKEFFKEFNLISVSFHVTVCRLLTYCEHCMVAFGMFYFSLKAISFWEWKKNPEIGLILPWLCDWFRNLTPLSNQTQN